MSIIAVILVASALTVTQFVQARAALVSNTVGLYLAEEGYELLRTIRGNNWDDIDVLTRGDTYYFDVDASSIAITSTPNTINGTYTRSFEITEVWRDNSSDDIVPAGTSGASVDDEIVEVTITVVGPEGTRVLSGILSNLYVI